MHAWHSCHVAAIKGPQPFTLQQSKNPVELYAAGHICISLTLARTRAVLRSPCFLQQPYHGVKSADSADAEARALR